MADSKFKKKSIKDTEGSGFGSYKEDRGGGSPKGGMYGGQAGRVGWQKRVDQGEVKGNEHRENQPRTKDGKFTYNSANGKSLKYKSRGVTVNPLLTGGENGVYIEDVEEQFENQKGDYYDRWKDRFYRVGSEKITQDEFGKLHISLSQEKIWEVARKSFDIDADEFEGESEVFSERKKGRPSKEETFAKEQAEANNEETYVLNPETGGIKEFLTKELARLKADADRHITTRDKFAKRYSALDPRSPAGATYTGGTGVQPIKPVSPVQPTQPVQPTSVSPSWGKSGRYTEEDKDQVVAALKAQLGDNFDPNYWTDDVIEEFMLQQKM